MGRTVLVWRLVVADLRRRRGEAALLMLAILASTTTLTLGLLLHGQTADPYQRTRAATAGPVAYTFPPHRAKVSASGIAWLSDLRRRAGVTASSGPYPLTWATLATPRVTATADVVGRDQRAAAVDQPTLTRGRWTRPGAVVLERSFADALGAHTGDSLTLNGRSFTVAGIAVTVAVPPYPRVCTAGCNISPQVGSFSTTGLAWLTRADTERLATGIEPLAYSMNLGLSDPARATTFADSIHPDANTFATSWQQIRQSVAKPRANERATLLFGSGLLGALAIASCMVLVGGRMAHQLRRAGLLKAVGGTPGLVSAVLLAEYLLVSLLASAIGLGIGRLLAPLLADPGSGLLGTAQSPPFTAATVALVIATALAIAVLATLVPAIRAARTSTAQALTDTARTPRRSSWLINASTRLPVALMLGVRTAARRPRRAVLSVLSIAITVAAIVAVLIAHARTGHDAGPPTGLRNPDTARIDQLLLVITVMLSILAAVNAVFITWATVIDTRRASSIARALGVTPNQAGAAISTAQIIPALIGAVLGLPAGILLVLAASGSTTTAYPSRWILLAVIPATAIAIAAITALPARLAARRPVAQALRTDPG